MFQSLFKNYIRSITRNIRFDLNFILRIISTLSIIYGCLFVFYLGLTLERFIRPFELNLNPVDCVNSILFYLFLIGTLLLYFFQSNYSHDLISYLHFPIKRNKIVSYILIKSLFNFFNLGFILFILPFSFTNVLPMYDMQNLIFYLTGVFLILIFVNYMALLIRNLIKIRYFYVLIPFGLTLLVLILKTIFNWSVESYSKLFFQSLLNGNINLLVIILLSLMVLLIANFILFRNAIYKISFDDIKTLAPLEWLERICLKNRNILYILLEIKLIVRNKRVNGFLFIGIGFLFLFYYALINNQYGLFFSFIIYIFLDGIFGYIFSQYLFSWESSYFDFLFTKNFDLLKYLKSKYLIYIFLGFFVFLLFLPLVIQKKIEIHLFVTALLFNSCIGYFILFYLATFNSSRIDLNTNIFFNLQGWNGTQVIAICIIIFSPLLLLFLLLFIFNVTHSLLIINVLSIFSILNQKKWFKIILIKLLNRKYINLEGYRK